MEKWNRWYFGEWESCTGDFVGVWACERVGFLARWLLVVVAIDCSCLVGFANVIRLIKMANGNTLAGWHLDRICMYQIKRASSRRPYPSHTRAFLPFPYTFSLQTISCRQVPGLPFGGDAQAVTRKLLERNIYFVAGREAPGQQASVCVRFWLLECISRAMVTPSLETDHFHITAAGRSLCGPRIT